MKLRREKIRKAISRCADAFSELGLTNEEIEIVSRSLWVGIKMELMEKEVEETAFNRIEEKKRTALDKCISASPAIIATLAVIISLISIALKLAQ